MPYTDSNAENVFIEPSMWVITKAIHLTAGVLIVNMYKSVKGTTKLFKTTWALKWLHMY